MAVVQYGYDQSISCLKQRYEKQSHRHSKEQKLELCFLTRLTDLSSENISPDVYAFGGEILMDMSSMDREGDEHQLKVAECAEKLIEISKGKEDYTQAVADVTECLSIRSSTLSDDNREIVETQSQLRTTHAVASDLEQASCSFMHAIVCLERHTKSFQRHPENGFLERLQKGSSEPGRDKARYLPHCPVL